VKPELVTAGLGEGFGERVRTTFVHCGAKAHDVTKYLTAEAVGRAIASSTADA
jgi:hypothetical protein